MSIRFEGFNWDFSDVVPFGGSLIEMTMIVPAKALMTVKEFGNSCGTLLAWGVVYWEFQIDGYPAYPYNRVMDQLGFQTGRQGIQEIVIPGGHSFTIIAYNPTAANCRLGISVGYELAYPEQ